MFIFESLDQFKKIIFAPLQKLKTSHFKLKGDLKNLKKKKKKWLLYPYVLVIKIV